jgi:nucleotide-binding universal stress UspA family protein
MFGSGYNDIIEASKQLGADMIILGTHGKTGIEKILVGSTAERVVRHSPIPVLTVRS